MLQNFYGKIVELINHKDIPREQTDKIDSSTDSVFNNVLEDQRRYLVLPQKPTFTLTKIKYNDGKSGIRISINRVMQDENGQFLRSVPGVYDATIRGYEVYRRAPEDQFFKVVDGVGSISTELIRDDIGLTRHGEYYYYVVVYDNNGNSNRSNYQVAEDVSDTDAPEMSTVTATADGQCYDGVRRIKVDWIKPNDEDYSHTTIEIKDHNGAEWVSAGTVQRNEAAFFIITINDLETIDGYSNPIYYDIRVRHYDEFLNYSEKIVENIYGDDIVKPNPPKNISLSIVSDNGKYGVKIYFEKPDIDSSGIFDVSEYIISRALIGSSDWGTIASITEDNSSQKNTYIDYDVVASASYQYRLYSKDKKGNLSSHTPNSIVSVYPDLYAPTIQFLGSVDAYGSSNISIYYNISDKDDEIALVNTIESASFSLVNSDTSTIIGSGSIAPYNNEINISGLVDGNHILTIYATDRVGNSSSNSVAFAIDQTIYGNGTLTITASPIVAGARIDWSFDVGSSANKKNIKSFCLYVKKDGGQFSLFSTIDNFDNYTSNIISGSVTYSENIDSTLIFRGIVTMKSGLTMVAGSNAVITNKFNYTDVNPASTISGPITSLAYNADDLAILYDNKRGYTGGAYITVPATVSNYIGYNYKFSKIIDSILIDVTTGVPFDISIQTSPDTTDGANGNWNIAKLYGGNNSIKIKQTSSDIEASGNPVYNSGIYEYAGLIRISFDSPVFARGIKLFITNATGSLNIYEFVANSEISVDKLQAGTILAAHIKANQIETNHISTKGLRATAIKGGNLTLSTDYDSADVLTFLKIIQKNGQDTSTAIDIEKHFATDSLVGGGFYIKNEQTLSRWDTSKVGEAQSNATFVADGGYSGGISLKSAFCGIILNRSTDNTKNNLVDNWIAANDQTVGTTGIFFATDKFHTPIYAAQFSGNMKSLIYVQNIGSYSNCPFEYNIGMTHRFNNRGYHSIFYSKRLDPSTNNGHGNLHLEFDSYHGGKTSVDECSQIINEFKKDSNYYQSKSSNREYDDYGSVFTIYDSDSAHKYYNYAGFYKNLNSGIYVRLGGYSTGIYTNGAIYGSFIAGGSLQIGRFYRLRTSGWLSINSGTSIVYYHNLNTKDVVVDVVGMDTNGRIHKARLGYWCWVNIIENNYVQVLFDNTIINYTVWDRIMINILYKY